VGATPRRPEYLTDQRLPGSQEFAGFEDVLAGYQPTRRTSEMSEALRRSLPNAKRDRARVQDAGGPVTDGGHPLEEAGTTDGQPRDLEGAPEAPPADEEVAEQMLEEERDEESQEDEPG
jgi:hypothetical protein